MKRNILKTVTLILTFVLIFVCAGCNSKDKKENKKTEDTKKEDVVEGFYVDEESGEIVDAATGEIVTDGSVKVDEKTGDIVDTKTGETVQTKKETEKVKKEVETKSDNKTSNNNAQSDSKDTNQSTTQNNTTSNTDKNQPNTNNGSTSNNTTNNNASNNTNNTTPSKKLPTSSKKVSLSRDRLFNKMMSIYTKPTLNLKTKMSRYEFSHQINGTIPSEIQYIFDWYFGIMDGGAETELTVKKEESDLFSSTAKSIMTCGYTYAFWPNGDGTGRMIVTKAEIDERIDIDYTTYSNMIDKNNANRQSSYDEEMKTYNRHVEEVNLACDLVVNAVSKANVSGKDEVTAINNIVNYICNNCSYWHWATTQKENLGDTIAECLRDGQAVCDGYAKTFYAMCYYAGVDVSYLNGKADDGGKHAWNSVNINGTTYYFDITWHDSLAPVDTYIWANKIEFDKEHFYEGNTIYYW